VDVACVLGSFQVDLGAMGWGFANATSRAFLLRGPNQPASSVPLIDLCNHAFLPGTGASSTKGAGRAEVVLSANSQVLPWSKSQGDDGDGKSNSSNPSMGAQLVAGPKGIVQGEPILVSTCGWVRLRLFGMCSVREMHFHCV